MPGPPVVSFSFDDFPRTALTEGGRCLRAAGGRGTYYAAFGLLGRSGGDGDGFTAEDVLRVAEAGHEIGCHSFSHVRGPSREAFERDIRENEAALRRYLPSCTFETFAYPFGDVSRWKKRVVATRYRGARSIWGGLNRGRIDLAAIRANRLYSREIPLAAIEALLSRNRVEGGWVVFYTHDVRANPSPVGCTPGYFARVVDLAVSAGSRLIPVSEAIRTRTT